MRGTASTRKGSFLVLAVLAMSMVACQGEVGGGGAGGGRGIASLADGVVGYWDPPIYSDGKIVFIGYNAIRDAIRKDNYDKDNYDRLNFPLDYPPDYIKGEKVAEIRIALADSFDVANMEIEFYQDGTPEQKYAYVKNLLREGEADMRRAYADAVADAEAASEEGFKAAAEGYFGALTEQDCWLAYGGVTLVGLAAAGASALCASIGGEGCLILASAVPTGVGGGMATFAWTSDLNFIDILVHEVTRVVEDSKTFFQIVKECMGRESNGTSFYDKPHG